jgi:hypothetical protein
VDILFGSHTLNGLHELLLVKKASPEHALGLSNERIAKIALRDGDVVLIGKHTVHFRADANEHIPSAWSRIDDRAVSWQRLVEANQPAQLDRTMVLDTRRVREMLRQKRSRFRHRQTCRPSASLPHSLRELESGE